RPRVSGPRRRACHPRPPRPAREARPPDGRRRRQPQRQRRPGHPSRAAAAPGRHQHRRRPGPRRSRPTGPPAARRLHGRCGRMRPSPLYKRLGLTGPTDELLDVTVDGQPLTVYSVRITRGGSDLSSYTASTATTETPQAVSILQAGSDLAVHLSTPAANHIASRVYETPADLDWRYRGRLAAQTAHDKGDRKGRWKGTTLVGAAWASLYDHAPDEVTPTAGMT